MFFQSISYKVSNVYHSIPGELIKDKASFVAKQAFQTLPCVAIGLTLSRLAPEPHSSGLVYFCASSGFRPLAQTAAVVLIVNQVDQYSYFSRKAVETASCSKKLYFVLLTYATVAFACSYFKILLPPIQPSSEKIPEEKTKAPSSFTLGLLGMSLAVQLRYAPISTLAGAAIGALMEGYNDALGAFPEKLRGLSGNLIKKYNDGSKAVRIVRKLITKMIDDIDAYVREKPAFNSTKSMEQKCYDLWIKWDFVACSMLMPAPTLMTSKITQGRFLAACLSSSFPKK